MVYLNRKLGLSEKMCDILHSLGSTILVMIARIEGSISLDVLQQALYLVQKHHPMLQAHILELADGSYFQLEDTPQVCLGVIDKEYEEQWVKIAEDELHKKFSVSTDPLFRVTFLRSSTSNGTSEVIASFHHAISDGISCIHFINELLSYYQKIVGGEDICEVVTMSPLPALENMLSSSLNTKDNVEANQEQSNQETQSPELIIECSANQSKRRTRIFPYSLSKETTIMLKKRSKQEGTTVHGALCAAMLLGAAKISSSNTPIHLSCVSSVNLRKYCQPKLKDDYIGCLADSVVEFHSLSSNTSFWDLARESKSKLNQSISNGNFFLNSINNVDLHQNMQGFFQALEPNMGRFGTVLVSNVGQTKLSENYGQLKLKEVYFPIGWHIIGPCLGLNAATLNEQLFCSFLYVVPLISAQTAEFFVDCFMSNIQKALFD